MESPPLKTSPPAGCSVAISLFSSAISLTASISRPIRTFSPSFLWPLSPLLAHSNSSNRRAIAPFNAFEFLYLSNSSGYRSHSPVVVRTLLGYLHPLLPLLWKSPARKYRRRRGNGGRTAGQRSKGIRTRRAQPEGNV